MNYDFINFEEVRNEKNVLFRVIKSLSSVPRSHPQVNILHLCSVYVVWHTFILFSFCLYYCVEENIHLEVILNV